MKVLRLIIVITLTVINYQLSIAQIAINTDGATPDASAMLDVSSIDKGILIPRMDSTGRNGISNPATGLMVYDTTTATFWYYDNSQWNEIATQPNKDNAPTDIQTPSDVSDQSIGNNPVKMVEHNNYLYILERGDDQIRVMDISLPTMPTTVTTFGLPSTAYLTGIVCSGDYAYVTSSNNAETQLWIFDISTPTSIDTVGSLYLAGAKLSSIDISGNHIYVTDYANEKLRVIDVSTPTAPSQVAEVTGMTNYYLQTDVDEPRHRVFTDGTIAYIFHFTSNSNSQLAISKIDISTPTSPSLVSTTTGIGSGGSLSTGILSFNKYGDYLYYSVLGDGTYVVNLNSFGVIHMQLGSAYGVSSALKDDYLIINDASNDGYIQALNLSNSPTSPSVAVEVPVGGDNTEMPTATTVVGSYLYTTVAGSTDKLYVHQVAPIYVTETTADGNIIYHAVDNSLGNHVASENLQLYDNWLSNDGDNEGISIDNDGNITISGQLTAGDNIELDDNYISNDGDNEGISIANNGNVTLSNALIVGNNIRLNGNYLSNDGGDEGILISDDGKTTFSDNILLNNNWLSNDGNSEGLSIDDDGNVTVSSALTVTDTAFLKNVSVSNNIILGKNLALQDMWLSGDGGNEGISIAGGGEVTFSDNILLQNNWLSNDGNDEGISIATDGKVTFSDNIILDGSWLSNDGDNEGISIDDDGKVNFSNNILLNGKYLSNDGGDEGISIDDDGNVTFSNNILLNGKYLSNDGGDEGISIDDNGNVTFSNNILLNGKYLSNDGGDEGISIDDNGDVTLSGALIVNGVDLANTAFTSENGITHSINNSDDFIIGADSINYNSGSELKMFYDKSQGAFRTGRVNNTNWDENSLGLYSFASGNNTLATGSTSVAFGYQTLASGTHSFAGGNQSEATANLAFAFGREVYAPSFGEVAFGLYGTSYTADETSAFDEDDRLFSLGNGTGSSNRSDAMVIYKSGDAELNGTLNVTGEASGGNDFIMTIDNKKLDGSTTVGARANGLLVRAGQNTGTNHSSYIVAFERPDGTQIGSISQTNSHSDVSYNTTSDIRLKANIQPTQYALADILDIQVRDYHYKSDSSNTPKTGFLAQQLYEVFPIAVTKGGEDAKTNPWTVDYSKLTPLLVKGMQDQQQIIEQQQAEIKELQAFKTENTDLKQRVSELEQQVEKINALEAKLEALLQNQ